MQEAQFELHYQPQVDATSGKLIGAEALIRWHDGENSIRPDQFIPVAEESGLIIPIGEWVIECAIAQIAAWRERFGEIPPIAINLSPRQFWRPSVSRHIIERMQAANLPSSALEVEITESVLLDADGGSIDELMQLRAAGIAIALDDFGTGYSSLSYLQRLPISTLKIDRSFINNLVLDDGSSGSEPLVRAIIAMAKSLSLSIVAEGVETQPQHRQLKTLGCDIIQGYLISRPLAAARNLPTDFSSTAALWARHSLSPQGHTLLLQSRSIAQTKKATHWVAFLHCATSLAGSTESALFTDRARRACARFRSGSACADESTSASTRPTRLLQ